MAKRCLAAIAISPFAAMDRVLELCILQKKKRFALGGKVNRRAGKSLLRVS